MRPLQYILRLTVGFSIYSILHSVLFHTYSIQYNHQQHLKDTDGSVSVDNAENTATLNSSNPHSTITSSTAAAAPTTTSTGRKPSFSACLLVKDDNYRLSEWLAYHLDTVNLSRLIVAVDPESRTQPTTIFDKFRKYGLINITEWSDGDFMPWDVIKFDDEQRLLRNKTKTPNDSHLERQASFYLTCMQQLKAENRTWTMLIDSDEFLVKRTNVPSPVDIAIQKLNNQKNNKSNSNLLDSCPHCSSRIGSWHTRTRPCEYMSRYRFGTQTMNDATAIKINTCLSQSSVGTPSSTTSSSVSVNPSINFIDNFQTVKWTKRSRTAQIGKTIIDVSRIQSTHLSTTKMRQGYGNPHVPLPPVCSKQKTSPMFVVYHYPAVTWEHYHSRIDARSWVNERSKYDEYNTSQNNAFIDDSIVCWLQGFYDNISNGTFLQQHQTPFHQSTRVIANFLLSDAGRIE
jgi:hypothetical protein